jgi:hypothetical protein
MATTLPAPSTQQARSSGQKELLFDQPRRSGGPSRTVDRDGEILEMNPVQLYDGRYEARSTAWDRLDSAWKTFGSEPADDTASSALTRDVSPSNGAAVSAAEVDAPMATMAAVLVPLRSLNWVPGVLGPAVSSKARDRAWVTRPRASCGTRSGGVESTGLRQQRSVGRCEAHNPWVVCVPKRRQKGGRFAATTRCSRAKFADYRFRSGHFRAYGDGTTHIVLDPYRRLKRVFGIEIEGNARAADRLG